MVSPDRFVSLEGADVLYCTYVHGTFCGIPTVDENGLIPSGLVAVGEARPRRR